MAEPATSTERDTFSFVEMEKQVLEFWESEDVFQQTLENTRSKKPYIFYDGPPFATGLPHHGHIVASTIKDIVPRYWTMKGRHVMRRFGWIVTACRSSTRSTSSSICRRRRRWPSSGWRATTISAAASSNAT